MNNKLIVRGWDSQGGGHFGDSRGNHTHNGIDIVCRAGEGICSLQAGEVTKLGYCYSPKDNIKGHLRYVEITDDDHNRWRYLYTHPLVSIGDLIQRGQIIGSAQGLIKIFKGITDHYHFEIMLPGGWKEPCIDPVPVLESLGYKLRLDR